MWSILGKRRVNIWSPRVQRHFKHKQGLQSGARFWAAPSDLEAGVSWWLGWNVEGLPPTWVCCIVGEGVAPWGWATIIPFATPVGATHSTWLKGRAAWHVGENKEGIWMAQWSTKHHKAGIWASRGWIRLWWQTRFRSADFSIWNVFFDTYSALNWFAHKQDKHTHTHNLGGWFWTDLKG